jgi:hypothetical protein
MYAAGASLLDIAAAKHTSPQTIGRRLQAAGVQLRGKAKTPAQRSRLSKAKQLPLDEDRLRDLQGSSTREIAAILGCSEECVRERMIALGIPRLPAKARMERNVFWRGGRTVDRDGYVLVKAPDHPHRNAAGYVREHRLVLETQLGRFLDPREVVDHIDGNRGNNDPANLRLFASNGDHLRTTLTGRTPRWSGETLAYLRDCLRRGRETLAANRAASGTGADPRP